MKIKIARLDSRSEDIPLPKYVTPGAAGMDICAAVRTRVVIPPGKTVLIPTGFSIELPTGFEAQIRPRSGLAIKHNVGLLNSPGTIDSDYRGEIKIVVTNFGRREVHRPPWGPHCTDDYCTLRARGLERSEETEPEQTRRGRLRSHWQMRELWYGFEQSRS